MLLNSDGGAGVGARRRAAGGEAGGVHLGQELVGGVPLQGRLHVQVLGDGRVHDATRQDVGEAAVVAGAPGVGHEDSADQTRGLQLKWQPLTRFHKQIMKPSNVYVCDVGSEKGNDLSIIGRFILLYISAPSRMRLSPPPVVAVRTVWYAQARRQHSHGVCKVVVLSLGGLLVVGQLKTERHQRDSKAKKSLVVTRSDRLSVLPVLL